MKFGDIYNQIFNLIESMGHKNLDNDIIKLNVDSFYEGINKQGQTASVELFKRKVQELKEADIAIFECSTHSLSIGYMVQKSLDLNKPTIVLYLKDEVPQFIIGDNNEKLIIKSYTKDTLDVVLKMTIEEASTLRDKRFNFFISPELLVYLDEVSRKNSISKSVFIRNLIEEHKKKDKKINKES